MKRAVIAAVLVLVFASPAVAGPRLSHEDARRAISVYEQWSVDRGDAAAFKFVRCRHWAAREVVCRVKTYRARMEFEDGEDFFGTMTGFDHARLIGRCRVRAWDPDLVGSAAIRVC